MYAQHFVTVKPFVTIHRYMADTVLLTDRREQLLAGKYNETDAVDRMALSRFRDSTNTALDELIKVAQSPHVDNTKLFEPEQVAQLIRAVLIPGCKHIESSGLIQFSEDAALDEILEDSAAEVSEEFTDYQNALLADISKLIIKEQYGD